MIEPPPGSEVTDRFDWRWQRVEVAVDDGGENWRMMRWDQFGRLFTWEYVCRDGPVVVTRWTGPLSLCPDRHEGVVSCMAGYCVGVEGGQVEHQHCLTCDGVRSGGLWWRSRR